LWAGKQAEPRKLLIGVDWLSCAGCLAHILSLNPHRNPGKRAFLFLILLRDG
jgi:hypothetical protein